MKEITEDYVNFETAKLLKEKGFDERTAFVFYYYEEDDGWTFERLLPEDKFDKDKMIHCPTQALAMKWLRDEKRYYIQVMLYGLACGGHLGYYVVIQKTDSDFEMMLQDAVDEVFYQTYEEACETAIKYVLENLI